MSICWSYRCNKSVMVSIGSAVLPSTLALATAFLSSTNSSRRAIAQSSPVSLFAVAQFAQMMGVTQGVLTGVMPVRFPVVMDGNTREGGQYACRIHCQRAAFFMHTGVAVAATCSQWSLPFTRNPLSSK
jgi:hypothetical protein